MQRQIFSKIAMVIKIIWILISFVVLFISLFLYKPGAGSDISIFLIYCMLALSFPSGILVAGCFVLIIFLQEIIKIYFLDSITSNHVGLFIIWFSFFIFGYFQWFVMLPWLWSLRLAKRNATSVEVNYSPNSVNRTIV